MLSADYIDMFYVASLGGLMVRALLEKDYRLFVKIASLVKPKDLFDVTVRYDDSTCYGLNILEVAIIHGDVAGVRYLLLQRKMRPVRYRTLRFLSECENKSLVRTFLTITTSPHYPITCEDKSNYTHHHKSLAFYMYTRCPTFHGPLDPFLPCANEENKKFWRYTYDEFKSDFARCMYAFILLVNDGYLKLRELIKTETARFFGMILRLAPEIQCMICNHAYGLPRGFFFTEKGWLEESIQYLIDSSNL